MASPNRSPESARPIAGAGLGQSSIEVDFLLFLKKPPVRLPLVDRAVFVFFDADDIARPPVGGQQVSTVIGVEKVS